MPLKASVESAARKIAAAETWNERILRVRRIPEDFGKAHHQSIYAAVAEELYVADLAPDFAYVHWRKEYELGSINESYAKVHDATSGFVNVDVDALTNVILAEPSTLRIFRLLLGFTTQEFAASTQITADQIGTRPLSNSAVKALENGRARDILAARVAAAVIDQAMRGALFAQGAGDVRSKVSKPDTLEGWRTVRRYAVEKVPLPVFLHQRHYGGAFRQLLDATSGRRGDLLEDAVEELFTLNGISFVRTGSSNQRVIAETFGLTVRPAPDFVVHDSTGSLRAILECKQANDGGTARDKASRFSTLRAEAARLGGVPVFAVLAGLGWRRTADTLGPVVRDTDGRVFTVKTLDSMITVDPFPNLRGPGLGSNSSPT